MNVFIPLVFINTVLIFCWLAIKDTAGFYAFTVFTGMSAASWQSMFPTCIASLSDDITKTGTRLGMAFTVISFAALVGGPIGGALLGTDHGGYMPPQVWAGVTMVLGFALAVGSRVAKYGYDWRKKC
jgi:predicted MFS family arabinose efflux permease